MLNPHNQVPITSTYIHSYIYIHTCIWIHTDKLHIRANMYVCTYVCVCTCVYMYILITCEHTHVFGLWDCTWEVLTIEVTIVLAKDASFWDLDPLEMLKCPKEILGSRKEPNFRSLWGLEVLFEACQGLNSWLVDVLPGLAPNPTQRLECSSFFSGIKP